MKIGIGENDRIEQFDNDNPIWSMDISEIDNWIETNVTSLATAKTALKKAARGIKSNRAAIDRIEQFLANKYR